MHFQNHKQRSKITKCIILICFFITYSWHSQANGNTEIIVNILMEIDLVMYIYLVDIINKKKYIFSITRIKISLQILQCFDSMFGITDKPQYLHTWVKLHLTIHFGNSIHSKFCNWILENLISDLLNIGNPLAS